MTSLPDLPSRSIRWALVVLFAMIALLTYGASLRNGFVHWDDGLLIYQNPAVMEASWAALKRMFTTYDPELYIPLTLLSYQFDYIVGGGYPWMFHAQNLLLHALNALLVMWFAFLLLRHRLVALLIGLLFLVHPLHTEAVAWASGRKDVLSTFFFLSSLIAFFYWTSEYRRWLYWLSIGLFFLGLLAKVMILTLPVVLLILFWRESGNVRKKFMVELVPYFGLSIIFGIVAMLGKTDVAASSTVGEKILMAGKSAIFYLQKIFWPADLSVIYPYNDALTLASPDFYLPFLALAGLIVACAYTLRFTRDIAAGFLFYLCTLAPTFINFTRDGDYYIGSDRYAYIPSIGIFLILAYVLVQLLEADAPMRKQAARLKLFIGASAAVLFVLISASARQSLVWANTQVLFENVVAHAPAGSYAAYNNLGNVYRLQKDYARAIEYYQQSLDLKPHVRTYSNFGAAYRRLGQFDKAIQSYKEAMKLSPESMLPHFGLGIVYAAQNRDEDAFREYANALALDPEAGQVYTNIGALHAQRNETDKAIEAYKKAVELEPYLPDAYYNMAVMLTELQRFDEAIAAYEQAIALQPRSASARINLGLLYVQKGDKEKSIGQFKAILKFDPDNPAAISALKQLGALN